MKNRDRFFRKSYAMQRMTLAIERAIERDSSKEKERAARWAAAWGLLCGIRSEGVNLRSGDVEELENRIGHSPDQIKTCTSLPFREERQGELRASPSDLAASSQPSVNPPPAPFAAGIFDPTNPF